MTTLKTVEEVVLDLSAHSFPLPTLADVLTQDRQATTDVLCALLADNYQVVLDPDGNETEIITLTLAQDIIRATLSNKDL